MKPLGHGLAFGAGVVIGGVVTFLATLRLLEWMDRKGFGWPP